MAESFGDVALLGLGASTQATGEYLAGLPAGSVGKIVAYAGGDGAALRARGERLEALGVRVLYGTRELDRTFDLGVVSPGIPCTGAFYANARTACAELVSEPELAWRESPRDWAAVTGTNGKTTTTALATELLRRGGRAARAVGNIGLPPIACLSDRAAGEVFVAELSSFQLESTRRFAPRAAVLLNVTPDHTEWHGSLEAYGRAKERVFANMGPRDLCVVGSDERCRAVARRLLLAGMRVVVLGDVPCACTADAAWVMGDGHLAIRLGGREHVLCTCGEMALKGPHNVQNALAAAALSIEMGADAGRVAEGLRAFSALAHRIEPCAEVAGVTFYDDSKATNVDAAAVALASFDEGHVVALLGGHDKGTDLTDFARTVVRRCRAAVVFGEAAPRFGAALDEAVREGGSPCAVLRAPHMREAFAAACDAAFPGDSVLLSPACSSFDEFSGYEERGRVFKSLVADFAARHEGSPGDGGRA